MGGSRLRAMAEPRSALITTSPPSAPGTSDTPAGEMKFAQLKLEVNRFLHALIYIFLLTQPAHYSALRPGACWMPSPTDRCRPGISWYRRSPMAASAAVFILPRATRLPGGLRPS